MEDKPVVFVVDDEPGMCRSLCRLLRAAGYPCKSYDSAERFLHEYDKSVRSCLILDVKMDGMTGLELQAELAKRSASIPIIVISGYADVPHVVQAMKGGAVDFLEKPFGDEALLLRVREALKRDDQIRAKSQEQANIRARLQKLTLREREVMDRLVVGKNSKQIGLELGISSKTVDIHRARVLAKTKVENVVELVQLLNRLGDEESDEP